jgi:death-on-curing family protein
MTTKKPTNDSPTNRPSWINLEDFEALCFDLTREFMTFDQPIPEFSTSNPGSLESCLKTPLQQFNGKDLYPTLVDKATILFYLMIKNHPFINGNKRMAITALLVSLYLNGYWVKSKQIDLYTLAKSVALSDRRGKTKDIIKINIFITKNIIKRRGEIVNSIR